MPGEHQGVGHQKVPLQLRGRRRAADRRQGPRSAGVTGTYLDGVCKFSRGYFGSPEVCEWCMQIGFLGDYLVLTLTRIYCTLSMGINGTQLNDL